MNESTAFDTLPLSPPLLQAVRELGFVRMTAVQADALPPMLAGGDVIARAPTGSGKTAAFALALLHAIDAATVAVQALVLCPTRELAEQVARDVRALARGIGNIKVLALCGGVPLGPQLASLGHAPHVAVGTPGRVLKHLRKGTLVLDGLRTLVLDEADRMLDMGFADELDAILEHVPAQRQTLLFSATFPRVIAAMSARVQRAPVRVDVVGEAPAPRIAQCWCAVEVATRDEALVAALHGFGGALNLVFCNTKADCARVTGVLQARGLAALALHGDLDQSQRSEVMVRFANRSASVLVATDVAARGLDVKDLDAVFNYELPREPDVYVHRIGRTARAGEAGVAVSLVAASERWRLEAVQAAQPDGELAEQPLPVGVSAHGVSAPLMATLQINGGRRNKLRPGDLLGTLTAAGGVPGEAVGRIDVLEACSFVAVQRAQVQAALRQLASRPIKGRQYRARLRR